MKKRNVMVGILVGMMVVCLVGTGLGEVYIIDGNWEYETIDTASGSKYGYLSSIGVNADGNIAMIHGDCLVNRLRVTQWNGTGWESDYISAIDSVRFPDLYISAVWDSNGTGHAVSVDCSTYDVLHTYWNGTGWETEIASEAGYAEFSAIAVDSNNYPHIVYYDGFYDTGVVGLVYAAWNGASWDIEPIDVNSDSDEYEYPSIAIDSNDKPHISYRMCPGTLYYGEKTGVSWVLTPIISGRNCQMTNIALDSDDNLHIVFSDWDDDYRLGYVEKVGSSWDEIYFDCVGYCPSITFDENDRPYIAYTGSPYSLRYAMYDGYEWYGEVVDTGETRWFGTDILLYNETVHISYQEYYTPDAGLKYATYNLTWGEWEYSHGIYGNTYLLPLYSPGKDAVITCENDTFSTSTTVNTTGYYIFDKLAAGIYWINATLYNYINNIAIVEVVAGHEQTTLDNCDEL